MAIRIPNQNPLDINQRVAVGVAIPFSSPSVFTQTFTTLDQIKSNIINFILTNTGERVLNPTFGANLRAQLFENITADNLSALEIKLINDIKRYFPSVRIDQLTLSPIYDDNTIQLVMVYSVLNNTTQTIQITL
jgi:phage baseplate assembly protein W